MVSKMKRAKGQTGRRREQILPIMCKFLYVLKGKKVNLIWKTNGGY
jgi:hypothetical protein